MSEEQHEGLGPLGSPMDTYGTILANPYTAGDTARHQLPAVNSQEVILRAARANTGTVYIGDSTLAQPGTGVMFDLGPGDSITLTINSTALLYVQQTVGADRLYVTVTR